MVQDTLLQAPFCFWYMRRGKGSNSNKDNSNNNNNNNNANKDDEKDTNSSQQQQNQQETQPQEKPANPYENSIKQIAKVSTVEDFWLIYNHLQRPNNLPTTTDYHFFRDGIKPTWEDPSNAKGGKWIVRLRKGLASRYWEEIVLALIGCQFPGIPYNEVCGAVVSIRYSEDIVSVWNRTANDTEITQRLRDCIKKILQLPTFVHMEYKPHETSLQDKSSFRNTQVWKAKSVTDGAERGGGSERERGGSGPERGERGGSRRSSMPRSGSWGNRDELRGDGGSKHSSWRSTGPSN
eukprot:225006_1